MGWEDVFHDLMRWGGLDGMKSKFGRSGDPVLDVRCLRGLVFELDLIECIIVS